MNHSYESSHSNLLTLSEMEQDKPGSRYSTFINKINQIYGIPLLQLDEIYTNAHPHIKDDSTNIAPSEIKNSIEAVDKLAINHNILKEMLHMIDNKVTFRHTENLSFNRSKSRKNSSHSRNKPTDRTKESSPHRLEIKMIEIREKLNETIQIINKELGAEVATKIKKVINIDDIKENSSNYEPSMMFSKEIQEQNRSKNKKNVMIMDRQKLDKAKQVTSEYVLNASREEENEDHKYVNLKCSLDRISEVQSGETIDKIDNVQGFKQSAFSFKNERDEKAPSYVKSSNEPVMIYKQDEKQIDQTGRIILSTINKKTVSTTTIPANQKGSSNSKISSSNEVEEDTSTKVRKSKFWMNGKSNLDEYSKNTLVSREQMQQSKVDPHSMNRKYFAAQPTPHIRIISPKKIHESNSHIYMQHPDERNKQFNASRLVTLQNSQVNPHFNFVQQQSQFTRHPLPYVLPQKVMERPQQHQFRPFDSFASDQKRNSSAPAFKQSRIVQTFPNATVNQNRLIARPIQQLKPTPIQNMQQRPFSPQIQSSKVWINHNPEMQPVAINPSILPNIGNIRLVSPSNVIHHSASHPIFNSPPLQQMKIYAVPPPQQIINRPSSLPAFNSPIITSPKQPVYQYTNRSTSKPRLEIVSPRSPNNRSEVQNAVNTNTSNKIENKVPPIAQSKPQTLLKSPITKQKFSFSNSNLNERMNQQKKIENQSFHQVKAADLKSESETVSNNDKKETFFPQLPPKPVTPTKVTSIQNPFNNIEQYSTPKKRQVSGGSQFRSLLNKEQLEQIIEISQGSAQNSIAKQVGEVRNELPSELGSRYQNIDTSREGMSSRKLKKRGIQITNHISNRPYRSQHEEAA